MAHIPKGTPRRQIKKIIKHEIWKRNFFREMARIDAWFEEREKLQPQWDKQHVTYVTALAYHAEKEYLKNKGIERGVSG